MKGKSLVFFVIIAVCVFVTQIVAYSATQFSDVEKDRVLNFLAFYTIAVQWIIFIHAGGFLGNERTEKYYDLAGSLTYLSTLLLSLCLANGEINTRKKILTTFVSVWASRLGWFLFTRISNNQGVDSRFTAIKQSLPRFLLAWTMQGMWVFLTMSPVLLLNQSTTSIDLGACDFIGITFWIVGFSFEVIADYQKSLFQKSDAHKEKWISTGLWSISRHPNYFGEILLWIGVALTAYSGSRSAFVFISPIFVALLLIFVSGIPLLEQKADKKFGDNSLYQKYKEETPVLVPFFGRKGNAKF